MRRLLHTALVLAMLAAPAAAQDDAGFLEGLIEDALSGDDRDVTIRGFRGVLSGRAQFDSLTISDAGGIWLEVVNVTLDWNRLAFLRRRLIVNELTAERISLPRRPAPSPAAATPEAEPFSFPQLPVEVDIDTIRVGEIVLGEPVIDYPVTLTVDGAAELVGGAGDLSFELRRIDGPDGVFDLDAAFEAEARTLSVALSAREDAGGIVATLAGLPGAPAIELGVQGAGPIDDYGADIRLATDGAERLAGRVESALTGPDEARTRSFRLDLGGDVTPLFLPEYQEFFGPDVRLAANGAALPDGRVTVDDLALSARSLTLGGSLRLAATRVPEFFDFDLDLSDPDGDPVRLPVSGAPLTVGSAALRADFDAARGEAWRMEARVAQPRQDRLGAEAITLGGSGTIRGLADPAQRAVTALFDLAVRGADLGSDAANAVLAETVTGRADLDWRDGAPLRLNEFALDGGSFAADGTARVEGLGGDLRIAFDGAARADDLSQFAALAGQPLAGSVTLSVDGAAEPLSGQFDLRATGLARDAATGQPQADAVLAGETRLSVVARRDEAGLNVEIAEIVSPQAAVRAAGLITSGASLFGVQADLSEIGLLAPGLSGPARIALNAEGEGRDWTFATDASIPGVSLEANGTARDVVSDPEADVTFRLGVPDLAPFSDLAGRPLGGSVGLSGTAGGKADLSRLEADLAGRLGDVALGQEIVDRFFGGVTEIALTGSLGGDVIEVPAIRLRNAAARLEGSASVAALTGGSVRLTGALPDLSLLLPELDGAFDLSVTADGAEGDWDFVVDGAGPSLRLDADGRLTGLDETPGIDADITAALVSLDRFAALAGLPLRGGMTLEGSVAAQSDLSSYDIDLTAVGDNIGIGQRDIDALMAGTTTADIALRGDRQRVEIDRFTLTGQQLVASAKGQLGDRSGALSLDARMADLGLFVPALPGPLRLTAGVEADGTSRLKVTADATGPSGLTATTRGTVARDFSTLDLALKSSGPLGALNRLTAPITSAGTVNADLTLSGPPALTSLAGTVTTTPARVVVPQVPLVLDQTVVSAAIGGGQVVLDVDGRLGDGRFSIDGPIALSAPFGASLGARLARAEITDGSLYRTRVTGDLRIDGPLTGGADIAGDFVLNDTLLRLDAAANGPGSVPDVTHVAEPAAVRETRRRAGLIRENGSDAAGGGGGGPVYGLDISVAANPVSVRGLGLAADLGGALDLRGTTARPVPSGGLNLIRGRLDLFGRRLLLEEATVNLPGSFLPFVRVVATNDRRSRDDAQAFAIIEGPVTDPEISFESDPQLPEDEVLALLLFGSSIADISPLQAAQIATTLSGGTPLLSGLQSGLGIDELSVTTDDKGETALTAGTYVTDEIYADVTSRSDGETEFRLNIDLSDKVTVTGRSANNGESGVGIFYGRDF